MLIPVIGFILLLAILILVHEYGHFIVAKKSGIRVEEFGLGLPPRITGIKKGETLYSLNWLPIGGFVKIFGEDGKNRENKVKVFLFLTKQPKNISSLKPYAET